MRQARLVLAISTSAILFGCARSPVESFGLIGFRGQRVVFVSDSADAAVKEESPSLQDLPLFPLEGSPEVVLRQATGQGLYEWGASCQSQYIPKRVSWDPRMGLSHASDGWNVGDAPYLLAYTKSTNTDYIVVLNKVQVKRGQVRHPGEASLRKTFFAEVGLDLSVIDAKEGRRVYRSPASGRFESSDSLSRLVPRAMELAIDNFFTALPQVHRWGCRELVDRFH
jgi:hypothetical protein